MIKQHLQNLALTKLSQTKALLGLLEPFIQDKASIDAVLNKEYKIAIVANMSAGKSTFINAMFADDILPAYSQATTDCPVYIYSDDNPDNDKAIIEFMDDKESIELSKDEVKHQLKFYARKDSSELDDKYKSVKEIHLHWDFFSLQNNDNVHLKFVIIDTPGPNNTDEFQDKHRDITKNIIQEEADMVLYLFDYGQIDTNLELSKGNIWDMIKQRKERDAGFEVFFIVNKIDMAFEDNRSIKEIKSSKTRDEFYQRLKDFWFFHENKAIEKIRNSAVKYGFSNPNIFTASAEYQKLVRMKAISSDDKEKLNTLKTLFKGVFKDDWDTELIDYLKISWIENRTRLHLDNIEQNILENVYHNIEVMLKNVKLDCVDTLNKLKISYMPRSPNTKHFDKKTGKWISKDNII